MERFSIRAAPHRLGSVTAFVEPIDIALDAVAPGHVLAALMTLVADRRS